MSGWASGKVEGPHVFSISLNLCFNEAGVNCKTHTQEGTDTVLLTDAQQFLPCHAKPPFELFAALGLELEAKD